jgi:hypothetical protein
MTCRLTKGQLQNTLIEVIRWQIIAREEWKSTDINKSRQVNRGTQNTDIFNKYTYT